MDFAICTAHVRAVKIVGEVGKLIYKPRAPATGLQEPILDSETRMLYKLGRLLQLVGLLILPVAMAGEVSLSMGLKTMLLWAGVGVGVFLLGRWQ